MTPRHGFEAIWVSQRARIQHARDVLLPGYLFVESLDDDAALWERDATFRHELADAVAVAEGLVARLVAPQRIYVLRFGESGGRMHFHIIPRTQSVLAGYLSMVADSAPYNGAKIAAWLWEHSQRLGHTRAEVTQFIEAARRQVQL